MHSIVWTTSRRYHDVIVVTEFGLIMLWSIKMTSLDPCLLATEYDEKIMLMISSAFITTKYEGYMLKSTIGHDKTKFVVFVMS